MMMIMVIMIDVFADHTLSIHKFLRQTRFTGLEKINVRGVRKTMQTISNRIFELLKERKMSQKEFARRTGIAESTISDWKKKKTNPVSDKILIICEVLGVTPYELLSGAEHTGVRSRENIMYVIDKGTELGTLVEKYQGLDGDLQRKLLGYMEALAEQQRETFQ